MLPATAPSTAGSGASDRASDEDGMSDLDVSPPPSPAGRSSPAYSPMDDAPFNPPASGQPGINQDDEGPAQPFFALRDAASMFIEAREGTPSTTLSEAASLPSAVFAAQTFFDAAIIFTSHPDFLLGTGIASAGARLIPSDSSSLDALLEHLGDARQASPRLSSYYPSSGPNPQHERPTFAHPAAHEPRLLRRAPGMDLCDRN